LFVVNEGSRAPKKEEYGDHSELRQFRQQALNTAGQSLPVYARQRFFMLEAKLALQSQESCLHGEV
jgi:hypothetical protein